MFKKSLLQYVASNESVLDYLLACLESSLTRFSTVKVFDYSLTDINNVIDLYSAFLCLQILQLICSDEKVSSLVSSREYAIKLLIDLLDKEVEIHSFVLLI